MVFYEGIFFDKKASDLIRSIELKNFPIYNELLHCTFKYNPTNEELFDNIVGREIEISIVGYGYDENNSGVLVSLPDEVKKYYINYDEENPNILKAPHITISLAEGAHAVNTKNLKFLPLESPIKVTGTFGYCIKKDNDKFISYKKYKKM